MPSRLHYYLLRIARLIRPKTSGIERLIYAVTYRCNSRCTMCNIWKEEQPSTTELILEDLKRTFSDQSVLQNMTDIGLTGGEPFLRDDLDQIGFFFLDSFPNARLSLNTNGLLGEGIIRVTKSLVKMLPEDDKKRVRVSFSVDGLNETHDSIRGIPNNFKKTIETLKQMKQDITGIEYGLTFTVLPDNYDQIRDVYLLSKELSVGFSFSMAQTSDTFYQNTNTQFKYTPVMLKSIEQQINDIQQNNTSFKNYYYSKMVEYHRNPHQYVTCYAGQNSFFLDPYGEVYPCILYNKSFGNIKERTLRSIIDSASAQAIIDQIRETNCHCWGCEAEVSFRRSWRILFWRVCRTLQNRTMNNQIT